jgi:putative sigma-54 modulation protein
VRLHVKAKNVELSESLKGYAQQKLGKLEKHLNDSARLELELAVEKNPSVANSQVAEATIWTKGPVIRARESSTDMKASIDLLVDKLERQAQRLREKRRRSANRNHDHAAVEGWPVAGTGEPLIVKTKQFAVTPMSAEDAVLQLELIGHDFFVFQNAETAGVNVIYRRRDGNYGLIEPELA